MTFFFESDVYGMTEIQLTIGIQRTLGTRGNFSLVARYQRVDVVPAFVLPVRASRYVKSQDHTLIFLYFFENFL